MISSRERILRHFKSTTETQPLSSVTLPHLFDPRPYQSVSWSQCSSHKRAVLIWHRRAGKDKFCLNYLIDRAWRQVGGYYYIFPTYSQGKKAIWEGRDKTGFPFLGHFPDNIILTKNQTELKIILTNGSMIRIVGSDNIDALMGTSPIGVIFSEYSLQSPKAWDYIRPILAENGGWAIFNGTPRGKNHLYDLYNYALEHPDDWYASLLTVDDTQSISTSDIALEKLEMSEDIFLQEYYCSFSKGQDGSWYGKYLSAVELDGRITNVPYDPYTKVDTFWDLGVGDATSIIFAQRIGQEIHIIDYYESNGQGLDHYARLLEDKRYNYGNHYAPHDIKVRVLTQGARTRLEIARDLGIHFLVVPDFSIYEGIEITRSLFHRFWFDETKCKYFLKCLLNYCKRYSEQYNVYSDQPLHNWASNGADAFRMLGISYSSRHEATSADDLAWQEQRYRRYPT